MASTGHKAGILHHSGKAPQPWKRVEAGAWAPQTSQAVELVNVTVNSDCAGGLVVKTLPSSVESVV